MKRLLARLHINRNSNAWVIIRTYIVILLVTTLLNVMVTAGVVSTLLIRNREAEAVNMIDSLQDSFVHKSPNWDAWEATSEEDTSDTYVKIQTITKSGKVKDTFYSPNTQKYLKAKVTRISAFPAVKIVDGHGVFYYRSKLTHRAYYQIWLSMNYILHMVRVVLEAVLLVAGLSLIVGVALILLMSRRLTKPLTNLTKAARERAAETGQLQQSLPVPETPTEVNQLAISFNQLLTSLNDRMQREHQFVSDASHELRTPLAGIRGHVSLIRRRGTEHPEIVPDSLKYLDEESLRMQHLVENLLAISRNDQLQLDLKPLDLTELLTIVVANYQHQTAHKITLKLPKHAEALGNEDSIRQIVLAILDNAVKYSPDDRPIDITVVELDNATALSISDQGTGISDADKAHVFERFYRVDQARSSKIPGTGLGLAIVSQLVALNHAKIAVTDNHPQGTTFTITFRK
ncbi:HAMP domain-containing sensor histidine kinase [Furfurilactobacillus rossiae]|nr:HAMP domain-containing sensor histidine kinase [Furfurilactobacillus rossiae]QFR67015.1 HAMP domain-containing protein [Furfurilactobacillus rossiae]QLE62520.1 Signal transduction histidine kinase [Furfurilactobacillus rossiae]